MITTGISGVTNKRFNLDEIGESDQVSIEYLSELTGFPEDFIKEELMINSDKITLKSLRENMMKYLEGFSLENN